MSTIRGDLLLQLWLNTESTVSQFEQFKLIATALAAHLPLLPPQSLPPLWHHYVIYGASITIETATTITTINIYAEAPNTSMPTSLLSLSPQVPIFLPSKSPPLCCYHCLGHHLQFSS